jgi:hypothetical protein
MSLLGSLSRGAGMARLADARAVAAAGPLVWALANRGSFATRVASPKRGFDHPATNPVIDPVGGADRGAEVTLKSSA